MPLPNLIIPGTQKSATTTLFYILKEHPDVFFPNEKEPHFFSNISNLNNLSEYKTLFLKATDSHKIRADGSTSYFYNPDVPKRLIKYLGSEIKFIFIFRNPIHRAISAYWQLYKRKIPGTLTWFENRRIDEVFRTDFTSLASYLHYEEDFLKNSLETEKANVFDFDNKYDDPKWPFRYVKNSVYSEFLRYYLNEFDVSQMLFLTTEELESHPEKTLVKIASFLNINEQVIPDNVGEKYGKTIIPLKGPIYNYVHYIIPYINKISGGRINVIQKMYKKHCFINKPSTPISVVSALGVLFTKEIEICSELTGLDLKKQWTTN
ncbi:MAG: hypothetical protein COA57_01005 [Flavobacteriales bacterium]|nr:MAG: hypothetical protein COA57_01005 [Flavobacteriales bacterium]